jgi:hypothetical protein
MQNGHRTEIPTHLLAALKRTRWTVSGKDDQVEPVIAIEPVSERVEQAFRRIMSEIADLAKHPRSDALGDHWHSWAPLAPLERELERTMRRWSPDDRAAVQGFLAYAKRQLETFLEDPHPFGSLRTDAAANGAWITNGITVGRQSERLSRISPGMRDFLQHARTSGGELLAPHPVHQDRSVPKHLEAARLAKRFNCPGWAAQRLQQLFLRYEPDERFVAHYAAEAGRRGFDSVFLELDYYSLHMAAVGASPADALSRPSRLSPYEEGRTELGRYEQPRDPEADEADDETSGGYETVEYHRVHGDRDPEQGEWRHMLQQRIHIATRQALPDTGKEVWRALQARPELPRVQAAIWHEYQLQVLRCMPRTVRWHIEELDRLSAPHALTDFGRVVFERAKAWTSCERKLFWGRYKARKADLLKAAYGDIPFPDVTITDGQVTDLTRRPDGSRNGSQPESSAAPREPAAA